ncbi:MAG TPA: hypothetical protein VER96_06880 [Polyangiaceae bacterium]|nr:hypothetical protein [Polyangiaceae bacterium]
MIFESKSRLTRAPLVAAALVGLATLGSAPSAKASSSFPAALQKALNNQFKSQNISFCVPTCAACHLTTKGGPGDLNVFGKNLEKYPTFPNLILGNAGDVDAKVQTAVTNYFASTPPAGVPTAPAAFPEGTRASYDSDSDGVSDYDELAKLDSPSVAFPLGVSEFCPDIAYGCFARVAAAPPPTDRWGLFSAGLVVFGLAAFRRLKRKRS